MITISILISWIITVSIHSKSFENHSIESDDWELIINSDGVKIYEQWVTGKRGFKVRKRKGIMEVNSTVTKAADIIANDSKTKLWMSGVADSYTLKKINSNEWYSHIIFNLPWPLENRDIVAHCIKKQVNENIRLSISSEEKFIPEKESFTRMTDYEATWEIEKLSKNKALIKFTALSDEPPICPRIIQDPVIRRTYLNNLINLKKLVNS